MCYVYIVECSDGTYYTGVAKDVASRIHKHNAGKGAKYTRARRPVVLKWQTELEEFGEALKLEYRIKQLSRKEKEELVCD